MNIHSLIRQNRSLYSLAARTHRFLHPHPSKFEFSIELSTHCNLHCNFCTHEELITLKARPLKTITPQMFTAVLDFIASYPLQNHELFLNLTGLGEPFTNPHFIEMLHEVRNRFPATPNGFSTNGTMLSDSMMHKLLEPNLVTYVCVSPRFSNRTDYMKDTLTDCYGQVADTIKRLFELRQGDTPIIHICVFASADFPEAQKQWQPYFKRKDRVYVVPKFDMTGFLHKTTPRRQRKCSMPYLGLTIDLDGYVYPCCEAIWIPREKDLTLGHISDGASAIQQSLQQFYLHQPQVERCQYCPRP